MRSTIWLILLAMFSQSCVSTIVKTPGIEVEVVDSANSKPLQGAQVAICGDHWNNFAELETDQNGFVVFDPIYERQWLQLPATMIIVTYVVVSKEGYIPKFVSIQHMPKFDKPQFEKQEVRLSKLKAPKPKATFFWDYAQAQANSKKYQNPLWIYVLKDNDSSFLSLYWMHNPEFIQFFTDNKATLLLLFERDVEKIGWRGEYLKLWQLYELQPNFRYIQNIQQEISK
ncbi:MAG: hypothetical protein MK193_03775 [Lentisphaeria bacterium]|nr:hypothetical protein [Lentisphaeria bacterium]